jgi:hypothetical protein
MAQQIFLSSISPISAVRLFPMLTPSVPFHADRKPRWTILEIVRLGLKQRQTTGAVLIAVGPLRADLAPLHPRGLQDSPRAKHINIGLKVIRLLFPQLVDFGDMTNAYLIKT